jgi:hypothetical protein
MASTATCWSVGLFLNIPQLQADEARLAAMPVFKRGLYKGQVNFSFTVDIINDTDKPAKFTPTSTQAATCRPTRRS